ncbi:MAG: hypothetical protein KF851_17590 [Pirellulaceae bacterium]|nr:hypothetical protein [Pirellulaceae bacterium]
MNHCKLFGWAIAICMVSTGSWTLGQPNVKEMSRLNPRMGNPIDIDSQLAESQGIRLISGQHLQIFTDIPTRDDIDELVNVFDAAVPQWCQQLGVGLNKTKNWSLVGFLMRDREKFKASGMLPDDLPNFPTGYNRGYHFWVAEQPGNYYTRHLVIHEGTHAFMQWFLGGSGPAWYSEGMAEKFGLHRWDNGELEINARLTHTDQCEYWGRPKFIREAVAKSQTIRLDQVFDLTAMSFYDVASYAWSWSACEFLSTHPLAADKYRKLPKHADNTTPAFSAKLKSWFKRDEWNDLERDWQLYLSELNYGTTADRTALIPAGQGSEDSEVFFSLRADHSWQSVPRRVKPGEQIEFSVSGQFVVMQVDPQLPLRAQDFRDAERKTQLAVDNDSNDEAINSHEEGQSSETTGTARVPVTSEATGISLRYYRGNRVGMLMAAVLKDDQTLSAEIAIGAGTTFTANAEGVLVFRINESPAELFDNSGELRLQFNQ